MVRSSEVATVLELSHNAGYGTELTASHWLAKIYDWEHLLRRFGDDWRVLFSHLVLFGFIYPSKRNLIPKEVIGQLLRRMISEQRAEAPRLTFAMERFSPGINSTSILSWIIFWMAESRDPAQ
jgi:hypothetical protein